MMLPPSTVTRVPRPPDPVLPPGAPRIGTNTRLLLLERRGLHARFELGQLEKIAAVQRQALDLLLCDHATDGVGIVLHLRRGVIHGDRVLHVADSQLEIGACGLSRLRLRLSNRPLKTRKPRHSPHIRRREGRENCNRQSPKWRSFSPGQSTDSGSSRGLRPWPRPKNRELHQQPSLLALGQVRIRSVVKRLTRL